MLPAAARLTRSQDFSEVVRRGRRAGRARLVVHALADQEHRERQHQDGGMGVDRPVRPVAVARAPSDPYRPDTAASRDGRPRVGFVVSKAVGGAVVRNRVSRRLRHLVRDRLDALAPGTSLVVRALPPAAAASSKELADDLDAALRRLRLLSARGGEVGPA